MHPGESRGSQKNENEQQNELVESGGALVETMTFNRRVVGSTHALAVT